MDFDARPVNAGNPWSRVSKAAPATSSRPGDAGHSRTPGPLTAPGTSSTSLPGFLARFPAIFRVLGLDIPWVWVGPPTTTRSAPTSTAVNASTATPDQPTQPLNASPGLACIAPATTTAGEVPRAFRTVHPLGWAIWKGEILAPTEEELLTRIQG